jgi:peptidyl-prolyl cis-trans isomerase D
MAKILVGLIIVVFALFGLGSITTFLAPVPKVAVVNGDDITQQEMEIAVERNRRLMMAQDVNPADIDEDKLREDVLQSLVNRKLLTQVVEDYRLKFSDELLDQEIVSSPMFQTNGLFNQDQFRLVIRSAGFTPVTYRNEMRRDKLFGQLSTAIASTSFVTDRMVERVNSISQQTRDIAHLRLNVNNLRNEIEVSDGEVQDYYSANEKAFETEETVDIGYIEIRRVDLMDEVQVEEAELQAYFDENKASYVRAESRRLAHILLEQDGDDESLAKAAADEIYSQILNGGDFGELAKEHSKDPGSAVNGGDLGFAESGAYVAEFEEVAFALELNQVSEPVKTEFGYHIIKLLEVEEGVDPTLDDVRAAVKATYRESLAEELFVTRSAELSELAFEAVDLVQPAADLGLQVQSTGHVGKSATLGIAGNARVMDAVFSADLLDDGNNSDIIEINPNHHVVVRVNDHKTSALRPLSEVEEEVRYQLRGEKAQELADARGTEIVEMLESGALTRFVADQFGLLWRVNAAANRSIADLDAEIRNHAFSLPRPVEGEKSIGKVTLAGGDVVVVSVTNVTNKAEDEITSAELAGLGRILNSQQGIIDFQEFQDTLAENATVERTQ